MEFHSFTISSVNHVSDAYLKFFFYRVSAPWYSAFYRAVGSHFHKISEYAEVILDTKWNHVTAPADFFVFLLLFLKLAAGRNFNPVWTFTVQKGIRTNRDVLAVCVLIIHSNGDTPSGIRSYYLFKSSKIWAPPMKFHSPKSCWAGGTNLRSGYLKIRTKFETYEYHVAGYFYVLKTHFSYYHWIPNNSVLIRTFNRKLFLTF